VTAGAADDCLRRDATGCAPGSAAWPGAQAPTSRSVFRSLGKRFSLLLRHAWASLPRWDLGQGGGCPLGSVHAGPHGRCRPIGPRRRDGRGPSADGRKAPPSRGGGWGWAACRHRSAAASSARANWGGARVGLCHFTPHDVKPTFKMASTMRTALPARRARAGRGDQAATAAPWRPRGLPSCVGGSIRPLPRPPAPPIGLMRSQGLLGERRGWRRDRTRIASWAVPFAGGGRTVCAGTRRRAGRRPANARGPCSRQHGPSSARDALLAPTAAHVGLLARVPSLRAGPGLPPHRGGPRRGQADRDRPRGRLWCAQRAHCVPLAEVDQGARRRGQWRPAGRAAAFPVCARADRRPLLPPPPHRAPARRLRQVHVHAPHDGHLRRHAQAPGR
jgi:hypothetical protein